MSSSPLPLSGQVLDAAGRPVAGAVLAWVAGPVPLPDIALLSGADGSFTITAPVAGRYLLACNSDQHGQLQSAVDVAIGASAVVLRLPG